MTGLCLTTSDTMVDLFMNYDIDRHTEEKVKTAEEKWHARREFRIRKREPTIEQTKANMNPRRTDSGYE